jgi:hypothetical protein
MQSAVRLVVSHQRAAFFVNGLDNIEACVFGCVFSFKLQSTQVLTTLLATGTVQRSLC